MRTGEARKYIVPMTRVNLGQVLASDDVNGTYDLGDIRQSGAIEVTFTPASEFITPALSKEETDKLIAATRSAD